MFYKIKPVPTAEEVKAHLPLSDGLKQRRLEFVTQTENILSGIDKRKLIIVGPCSADSESPVCEYAENLARVAQKIKSVAHVIMRVYTGKPRTRGDGYTGMIHTPDPKSGITDINSGLVAARKLHIKVAETSGLFTADEILYPNAVEYTDDIVSYSTIGARSAQDPLHRYVASGLDFPIGVKNPIHGNVGDLIDSLYSVGIPNEFLFNDCQTRTSGNKFAHAVLRGAVDINGKNVPNYGCEYVMRLYEASASQNINRSVIIDTGHANSGKCPSAVDNIVNSALEQAKNDSAYDAIVKGFMIESYIEDGSQSPNGGVYGKSITDPCLGWAKTEKLLLSVADKLAH